MQFPSSLLLLALAANLVASTAETPADSAALFNYDKSAPLDIRETGVETRGHGNLAK